MWVLVFITVFNGNVKAIEIDRSISMLDCFYTREELSIELSLKNPGIELGHFPPGTQAVCIYTGDDN